jgi:hypothetical protein
MKSIVAGIIDSQGGVRVCVDETVEGIMACVGHGEHCYVVPNMKVQEPVQWDKMPALIETVHSYVAAVAWHKLSSRTQALLRGLGRLAEP